MMTAVILLATARYSSMFVILAAQGPPMTRSKQGWSLAAVLAFGLAAGLCGIQWGLPGPERLRACPPQLLPTAEIARELAERWRRLYEELKRSHAEMRTEEPVTYVKGVDEI